MCVVPTREPDSRRVVARAYASDCRPRPLMGALTTPQERATPPDLSCWPRAARRRMVAPSVGRAVPYAKADKGDRGAGSRPEARPGGWPPDDTPSAAARALAATGPAPAARGRRSRARATGGQRVRGRGGGTSGWSVRAGLRSERRRRRIGAFGEADGVGGPGARGRPALASSSGARGGPFLDGYGRGRLFAVRRERRDPTVCCAYVETGGAGSGRLRCPGYRAYYPRVPHRRSRRVSRRHRAVRHGRDIGKSSRLRACCERSGKAWGRLAMW